MDTFEKLQSWFMVVAFLLANIVTIGYSTNCCDDFDVNGVYTEDVDWFCGKFFLALPI